MSRIRIMLGAAALASALVAPANANLVPGRPVVVKHSDILVTVEFISADPDFVGNLYFLGSGDRSHVLTPAPDTDSNGLGQFLFNNETAIAGSMVQLQLEGTF